MSLHKKLPLALAAFALVASLADAQATSWNRRISDVHIVHPPATPPGTWRITAVVEVSANGVPPGSLSFDCAPYVEGTLFALVTVGFEPSPAPTVCPGDCSGGCSIGTSFGVALAGSCSAVGGCHCGTTISVDLGDLNAATGTNIQVVVTPTFGSLSEFDTSDDAMTRQIPENNPGTLTCAGDGSSPIACPCANNGASGHGCSNSSNPNGAELKATKWVEHHVSGLNYPELEVTGMPSGAPLLYFQGTSNALSFAFGDGTLCTTGTIIRLRVKINVGGASKWPEPGEPNLPTTGGVTPGSGVTTYYQAYYRDSATYCTSATFNMTNGISLTWY